MQPSTCLRVWKWGFIPHKVMYVGPIGPNGEDIVTNSWPHGVRFDHYDKIAAGSSVQMVEPPLETPWEQHAAVARAVSQLGKTYNLITNNCETTTNFARFGKAVSPLVIFCVLVALGLLASFVFLPKLVRRPGFWPAAVIVVVFGLIFLLPKVAATKA